MTIGTTSCQLVVDFGNRRAASSANKLEGRVTFGL